MTSPVPLRIGLCLLSAVLLAGACGCAQVPLVDPVAAGVGEVVGPVLELPAEAVKDLAPSNDRDWSPDLAVLSRAEFNGNEVTIRNIRNCNYRTAEDYDVAHYDKTFDVEKIRSLDFVVVPFLEMPALAHIAVSFGFEGDEYLGVSVEIRKEQGETYAPTKGVMRQFELMYVVADERDMIRLCTDQYLNGVYVYRANAPPAVVRAMFVDMMHRVNELADKPEFYNTFTNNCTTNIVRHINSLGTGTVPYDYRVLMPGYFDKLVYDLEMIEKRGTFEQTKESARVNRRVYEYAERPDFSAAIRR
ncbi:MAG: lipoprotein N-acyltransferase Lnb domain-containing protein [Thermoguttaceae bacterium]